MDSVVSFACHWECTWKLLGESHTLTVCVFQVIDVITVTQQQKKTVFHFTYSVSVSVEGSIFAVVKKLDTCIDDTLDAFFSG